MAAGKLNRLFVVMNIATIDIAELLGADEALLYFFGVRGEVGEVDVLEAGEEELAGGLGCLGWRAHLLWWWVLFVEGGFGLRWFSNGSGLWECGV